MSEDQSQGTPQPVTLRQLREQAGLHLVALAAMLKVPPQKLEALEAGRYDELPDMTFARALASSVCRALKADPAPILAALPQSGEVRLGEQEGQLNTPFPVKQEALMNADRPISRPLRKPLLLAGSLLVVAAILWWALPIKMQTVPDATAPVSSVQIPLQPSPSAATADSAVAPSTAPVPVVVAPVVSPQLTSPVPATESPAAGVAVPLLQLRARQTTWVQVRGSTGQVVLERNLPVGETVALSDGAPLAVVVGRAGDVEVTVRGQAMDIQPFTRNNVARFEVK